MRVFKTLKKPTVSQRVWPLVICFIIVGITGYTVWRDRHIQTIIQPSEIITFSTDTPVETPPIKQSYRWKGKPDEPKFIRLPSIGTEGFIQNVGVDQNKQIAVPNNIYFAGWFVDSVRPGQKGLSIIDGHVDGRENEGIFKRLSNLEKGDRFDIELGDGSTRQFKVRSIDVVPTEQAANYLFSQDPAVVHQLNLITCGGNYNAEAGGYDQRIIVTSELVTGS